MARWLRLGCVGIIAATMFCSGCWDSVELPRRALVAGAAVDVEEDGQYRLTLQIIRPQPGKAGGTDARVQNISGVGGSISEAERVIDRQTADLLFFAAQRILIVSQDAAKSGLTDTIDEFMREREPRETMQIAIAQGTASDLLLASNLGTIPSYGLADMLEEQIFLAEAPTVDLLDITNAIKGEGAPFAPLLAVAGSEGAKRATVVGTQVFNEDMPAGVLDFPASRGLLWTLGLVRGGIAPITGHLGTGVFTMAMVSISSAVKASVDGGAPLAIIELEVEADVIEATDSTPLSSAEGLAKLEEVAASSLRDDINATVAAMKELDLDLFDLGDLIRSMHPKQWREVEKQWPQPLQQLKTDIRITMSVERTGLIKFVHEPK